MKRIYRILLIIFFTPVIAYGLFVIFIIISEWSHQPKSALECKTLSNLKSTAMALEEYYVDYGEYPKSLNRLFTIERFRRYIVEFEEKGFIDGYGRDMYYAAKSNSYTLHAVGKDLKPMTHDDIYLDKGK